MSRIEAYRLCERLLDGAYSNLAAAKSKNEHDNFHAYTLSHYLLENKLLLEHIAQHYVKKPLGKLDREVYIVLLMGICELRYLSTPANAAVNEYVDLIKSLRKTSASGLVNAVLRNFLRDKKAVPEIKGTKTEKFSVEYSIPLELLGSVINDYGEENAYFWGANLNAGAGSFRANTTKPEGRELADILSGTVKDKKRYFDTISRIGNKDFREQAISKGLIHMQGISSQLCALALGAKSGETVIDICAAPGGKSFTIAEEMQNKGTVISCDKTDKRVGLIEKGAKRLGLTIIKTLVNDGAVYNDKLPMADRVLCDVPCSGYGVIHSKPEIRYKPLSAFDGLPALQYDILRTSSRYVKSGGTLVYSTCTVRKCENEDIVKRFLSENPDFYGAVIPAGEKTVTPLWQAGIIDKTHLSRVMGGEYMKTIFEEGCDGFFIAVMKRK